MTLADEIEEYGRSRFRDRDLEQMLMPRLCAHLGLEMMRLKSRWGLRKIGESRWMAMYWPFRSLDDCKWFFKMGGIDMPESGPYDPVKATAHILRAISPKSGGGL